ncbi:MAG: hypothetical protein LBJ67_11340 [Planctomycetaceae bacterium]|jgi:hypothetical protein|nr:hypothetical protein [Planctomycetaceae bacterium]
MNQKPFFSEDVDEILRNAELRTELEPYFDESISRVNVQHVSLQNENEYLAAMLEWEKAPVLPIYRWFEPELRPPHPEHLNDVALSKILVDLIQRLYEKKIVLDFTDHLSDRELYLLICQNILPAREKKIDTRNGALHWDCSHNGGVQDPTSWLKYYASDEDRDQWADQYYQPLPEKEIPLYPRYMPQDPF